MKDAVIYVEHKLSLIHIPNYFCQHTDNILSVTFHLFHSVIRQAAINLINSLQVVLAAGWRSHHECFILCRVSRCSRRQCQWSPLRSKMPPYECVLSPLLWHNNYNDNTASIIVIVDGNDRWHLCNRNSHFILSLLSVNVNYLSCRLTNQSCMNYKM